MSKVLPNSGPGAIRNRHYKSHLKHFGATMLTGLPAAGLGRKRMSPLDQEDTEFCTAYGEATSSGYEKGIQMSGEWQTAAESEFIGTPITAGADPVPSMMATTLNGSLPLISAPAGFSLDQKGPAFIANWLNWPKSLWTRASLYLPGVPFYVDGPYDIFDNIRNALWQAHLVGETGVVKAFGFWYESWNVEAVEKKGMLTPPSDSPISRHRYNFIDWTTINGQLYLVAALTQGTGYGDGGFLYFDRATVDGAFQNATANGLGLYINRSTVSHMQQFLQWLRAIGYYLIARANSIITK